MARSRLAAHLNDGEQRVRAELAIEERVPRVLCDHAPRREHGNAAVLQLSLAVPGKVQLRVNSCPPHTGSCTWTCTCARTLLCSAPVPSSALRHPAASATRPALPPCTGFNVCTVTSSSSQGWRPWRSRADQSTPEARSRQSGRPPSSAQPHCWTLGAPAPGSAQRQLPCAQTGHT